MYRMNHNQQYVAKSHLVIFQLFCSYDIIGSYFINIIVAITFTQSISKILSILSIFLNSL